MVSAVEHLGVVRMKDWVKAGSDERLGNGISIHDTSMIFWSTTACLLLDVDRVSCASVSRTMSLGCCCEKDCITRSILRPIC